MSVAIILATRNRPELVLDTIERTQANIVRQDTKFIVAVDDDDEPTIRALDDYLRRDAGVTVSIRPREDTLGEKYNRALEYAPDAGVYLVMVDYAPHITPGFDQKVWAAAQQFPDGIGVVYNWWANLSFPGINAVTKRLADLMGYIYPPYFSYWFIDHWLDDIARYIDRIAFADVHIDTSIREKRVASGQAWTQEMREPDTWATFFDMCVLEKRNLAYKIIDAMDEPQWRKDMLKNNHQLVEHHSVLINQNVRDHFKNAGIVGEMPERYKRVRDAAKEKAAEMKPLLEEAHKIETMPIMLAP